MRMTATMTPTDYYENNDIYLKSDASCREIPTFLRLCRNRSMLHTGTKEIALTGVSHTVTSREKIYIFPAASRTVVSHSGDVPSPETPRSMTLYR